MTITRPRTLLTLAGLLLAASAAGPPVASADPPGAEGPWAYRDGCIMYPLTPQVLPGLDALGRKVVRYPIRVTCMAGRTARLAQQAFEIDTGKPGDAGSSDRLASWSWYLTAGGTSGTHTFENATYAVLDWDSDDDVELLHTVSFFVESNGVKGAPTPPLGSPSITVRP